MLGIQAALFRQALFQQLHSRVITVLADIAFIYPVFKSKMQHILRITGLFSRFPAFRDL